MGKKKNNNSKKSMGKGLSSLFNTSEINEVLTSKKTRSIVDDLKNINDKTNAPSSNLNEIAIEKIIPNPNQPRSYFEPTALSELATSIKEVGIIQPLIVYQATNQKNYELIAGERRWRAAQKAGLKTVPVVIKDITSDNLLEAMLIENIQREDLSPIEEAESYQIILTKKQLTHEQLANRVGKSRGHITNLLRVLNLPATAKQLLSEGKLTLSQAKVILTYFKDLDDDTLTAAINSATTMTVKDLEKHLKKLKRPTTSTTKKDQNLTHYSNKEDPNLSSLENILRDKLKTKVKLTALKNGLGKLEIDYYDYNQLNNIVDKF